MDLKKPLTFDEQLDKLVDHGMIIIDRQIESKRYSEKDAIAHMVGVGRDTLENHLYCLQK